MSYKVAIASKDGKVITEHFGRCRRFLIADIDPQQNEYRFDGFLDVTPPCNSGEHDDSAFQAIAEALSGCRIVLVNRIGPAAEQILGQYGIDALEYPGLIDDALLRIMKFYK